jgi:hypothetical protein
MLMSMFYDEFFYLLFSYHKHTITFSSIFTQNVLKCENGSVSQLVRLECSTFKRNDLFPE